MAAVAPQSYPVVEDRAGRNRGGGGAGVARSAAAAGKLKYFSGLARNKEDEVVM